MRRFILWFALALFTVETMASPAYRWRKAVRQSDGSTLTIVKGGDEYFSFYTTLDNIPVMKADGGDWHYAQMTKEGVVTATSLVAHDADIRAPYEGQLAADFKATFEARLSRTTNYQQRFGIGSQSAASVHAIGKIRIPILLVQYSDVKFQSTNDVTFFQRHFNASNYSDEGGGGSVRDYFIAQSDSLFQPTFDIFGPVTVSRNMAYYGKNSGGSDMNDVVMASEAIDSAVAKGYNFSAYTTAGTTNVPFIGIIFAGEGEQVTDDENTIWAKYQYFFNHSAGGLMFNSTLYTDEVADYGDGLKRDGIGTFCHEFSHAMGLPDFYNTNGLTGIFGMDRWDIMDWGQFNNSSVSPMGYSAYEREFMGWLKIDTLKTTKQLVTLPPLHSNASHRAYRLLNANDATGNEYYIVENIQPSTWYARALGQGMMVMHVHYDASLWANNNVNNNRSHQRMTLIPADGTLTPASSDFSKYKGDLFPGLTSNTELSDTTTPCDTAYAGQYMHRRMKNIKINNGNVTFVYMAEGLLDAPQSLTAIDVKEKSFTVSWAAVEHAERYCVRLTDMGGQTITDTVTTTSHPYSALTGGTAYTVTVAALNGNYIDSQPSEITVNTLPVGIRSIQEDLTDDDVTVYSIDGKGMGTQKMEKWLHGHLQKGIYIFKKGSESRKVIIQ